MMAFSTRFSYAFRCFFSLLFSGTIPQDIGRAMASATGASAPNVPAAVKPKPSENPPVESFDRAVQMLALLQRDGRLIDFLSEDVSPYPDSQLGAAVRTIHASCRQVLDRYLKLEPVISSEEDQPVTVPAGFDPATVKLLGNVVGQPPVKGLLRHRGWRVTEVRLPSLPQGRGVRLLLRRRSRFLRYYPRSFHHISFWITRLFDGGSIGFRIHRRHRFRHDEFRTIVLCSCG